MATIKPGTLVMVSDYEDEIELEQGFIGILIGICDGNYYIPHPGADTKSRLAQGFKFCKKVRRALQ